ncbi:DUF1707 domain-containing protein [Kibdelosporangium philippinense]|uniref:DUF1707 domain-containing protein n=1 Tax=Kibdelosporangium philippinense TaxID=211113 RepID=A0ABS8Z6E5_9PSEU|nr:DUF1707 domain-containing protein [Kibdelosporangium philippinense]MCE7003456.1 DUF1707 domain-containing protein [Kibdelosporangium philippinense]
MGEGTIRISDAEREEAVTKLGEHMTTGRLDLSEYEERCGQAAAARTRADLEALFEDLPAPHPDLSSATRPVDLVKKTGQLVSRSSKVETPATAALDAIAEVAFVVGIPAAILLTIFLGMWWLFIPVGAVLVIAGSASDAAKKRAESAE